MMSLPFIILRCYVFSLFYELVADIVCFSYNRVPSSHQQIEVLVNVGTVMTKIDV
jgi:hypothetical protein